MQLYVELRRETVWICSYVNIWTAVLSICKYVNFVYTTITTTTTTATTAPITNTTAITTTVTNIYLYYNCFCYFFSLFLAPVSTITATHSCLYATDKITITKLLLLLVCSIPITTDTTKATITQHTISTVLLFKAILILIMTLFLLTACTQPGPWSSTCTSVGETDSGTDRFCGSIIRAYTCSLGLNQCW